MKDPSCLSISARFLPSEHARNTMSLFLNEIVTLDASMVRRRNYLIGYLALKSILLDRVMISPME